MVQVTLRQLVMRPQEIMGEIVILYLHPGTFSPSSPDQPSPASGSLLMHLLFFLIVYHSYLFLSIVSYTILTQLSSACCLELEAFTRCASWPGNSAHHGVTHIATLRIIANVQGNARGKMWTLVYTY